MEETTFDKIVKKFELDPMETLEFREYLWSKSLGENIQLSEMEEAYYGWVHND
jgi:hypothetical protein